MDVIFYSDFLIRNAAEHGDRTAVIAEDAVYTYEELNRTVNRFANGLRRRGIREGDRVMAALRDEGGADSLLRDPFGLG